MVSEREVFELTGPSFLTSVDWNNLHHRRSIAASLVKGVSILERDRRQNRQGPQALAPPWWEFFNFKLIEVLVDNHDMSYFGAIYEFNWQCPHYSSSGPPRYVIAFRGTINQPGKRAQDFKLNLHCMINNLQESSRFQIGMESTLNIVSRGGYANVWLAGHSLGSSIALLIGRKMVKTTNTHLKTYLFNPPFISAPIELIKSEKVKFGLRLASSVLTAGLAVASNVLTTGLAVASSSRVQENDPFIVLSSWIPYLFVNQLDHLCSEYIGYFEHREMMESFGVGKIGKLATRHSIGSIVSRTIGKNPEAVHLIPSAYLTINSTPCQDFKEAHGIQQWWKHDSGFKYKLYQYK